MIRIAAAQINPTVGDLAGNQAKIIAIIRQAKAQEADIVAFPELVICGYPPEDLLYKDHFVRDNIKVLRSLIKETKGITAIVGFVDMDKTKKLYNSAAILSDRKIKGIYRKEELPNYGVFDEKRYFHQGKSNKIFSVSGLHIGVSICEDIWIDQGVCQEQSKKGAKLLREVKKKAAAFDKKSQADKNIYLLCKSSRRTRRACF